MDSHYSELPCSQRRFPLRLASWLPGRYASYLRWLSHLVERLGADRALALWQGVQQGQDDALVHDILAALAAHVDADGGWSDV